MRERIKYQLIKSTIQTRHAQDNPNDSLFHPFPPYREGNADLFLTSYQRMIHDKYAYNMVIPSTLHHVQNQSLMKISAFHPNGIFAAAAGIDMTQKPVQVK